MPSKTTDNEDGYVFHSPDADGGTDDVCVDPKLVLRPSSSRRTIAYDPNDVQWTRTEHVRQYRTVTAADREWRRLGGVIWGSQGRQFLRSEEGGVDVCTSSRWIRLYLPSVAFDNPRFPSQA
jgi:hypothetical protein